MKAPRGWLLLLGTLLIIGALYNHYLGHSAYLVEMVLIAAGAVLALFDVRRMAKEAPVSDNGILTTIVSRLLSKKQANTLIPFAGFAFILGWSVWKLFVTRTADLRMNDFIVTLLGLSLILYPSGPSRYTQEKDFIVLYLAFLAIVFVVIWNLYTIATGDSFYKVTAYFEYYFITVPTVALLRLFGVGVSTDLDLSGYGITNLIGFEYQGRTILLGIGTGCSGLYSAGLFFSAFLAFVLVRYRKVDPWILTALALGFFVTWLSNIIRMAMTIAVGAVYGPPTLSFFHGYIGIVVFVAFVTVFWVIIVRWLDKVEGPLQPQSENKAKESSADTVSAE